jgi:hypothetical protein
MSTECSKSLKASVAFDGALADLFAYVPEAVKSKRKLRGKVARSFGSQSSITPRAGS